MYQYLTLENVSKTLLYDTFLEAFQGFAIVSKSDMGDFYDLLENKKYDPAISVGAFCADTNELVAFVLNSGIYAENKKTVNIILTGTKPLYRRQGIMNNIFHKAIKILRQKQTAIYSTEVLVTNLPAIHFYQAQGFEIKNEIMTVISTKAGTEQVVQYEIAMNL